MTDGQTWLDRARREPDPARADLLAARAVNAHPESPDAYVLRGQIAVHRGDVLAAAHHLRIAFARGARDAFTRDVLGLCLAAAGQPELAGRMRVSADTPPALQAVEARLRAQTEAVRAVLARALPPPNLPGWLPGESAPAAEEAAPPGAGARAAQGPPASAPEADLGPGSASPPPDAAGPRERAEGGGIARALAAASASPGAGPAEGMARTMPPAAAIRKVSAAPTPRASTAAPTGAPTPRSGPLTPGEPLPGLAAAEGLARRAFPSRDGQVSVVRTALPTPPEPAAEARGASPPAQANLHAPPQDTGGGVRVVRGPASPAPGVSVEQAPPAPLPPSVAPLEMPRSAPPAPRPAPVVGADGQPRPMHLPTASTAPAPVRPLRIHRIATVQPDWLDSTPQYHAETVPGAADWVEGTEVPGQPRAEAPAFTGGGIELALDPGEVTVAVRSPVTGRLLQADDARRHRQGGTMPSLDVAVGLLDARDAFAGLMDLGALMVAVDLPGPVLTRPQHPPRQLAKAVAAGLTAAELLLRDRHNPAVALQRLGLGTFERIEVLSDGGQLSCVWADGRALHLDLRALRVSAPVVASAFVRALLANAETASGG